MNWYLAKIVHRIVCGEGDHIAQFDEQLRLIYASDVNEAFDKAILIGRKEEETFYNHRKQIVQWKFVNVPELYSFTELIDGAEMYSKINEVDDADAYINFVNHKAASIRNRQNIQLLNLI
jgi:hypothetical protein